MKVKYSLYSFYAAITFVTLLTILHFLKPEIEPTWRFISEYAIGKFGILMSIAFFSWAFSYIFLFMALRKQLSTVAGKIGLLLILINAGGLILAGIFTTDPATSDLHTTSGNLHNLGGTMGMAMPFASLLVCIALFKKTEYLDAKKAILFTTILVWIGFLISAISLGYMFSQNGGKLNPTMWVGIPTRFEVLTYCIWLITISIQSQKTMKIADAK